jgi:hypothetical protein
MRERTLKSLYAGAGVACVFGLLMGAVMKPTLDVGDRPEGPQILAGWSGARSTGPFDDSFAFTGYQGEIPDYVVGTDWRKDIAWQEQGSVYDGPSDYALDDEPPPSHMTLSPAVFDEPKPEAPAYPSMAGGVAYGVNTPAPPPPQEATETATFDEDAPPEAAGDTTLTNG